jgi:alpha-mannosidase
MSKVKIQIIINLIITLISYSILDINIHIIPHTHLDPGWLKTPEEYYRKEKVNYIFDTILSELSRFKEKTFVINEIYYFKIWYSDIKEEKKLKLKELIKQKRIEFVSGSYTINDEANPLYYNIIDQIRIGHQFLLEEFGIIPKTAWYIDSFGHSAGNAHILAQMKFKYLVLQLY